MKQEEKMKGALGEWLEKSGKVIEVFRPKPNNLPSSLTHRDRVNPRIVGNADKATP